MNMDSTYDTQDILFGDFWLVMHNNETSKLKELIEWPSLGIRVDALTNVIYRNLKK
jgi:hypothetical protein